MTHDPLSAEEALLKIARYLNLHPDDEGNYAQIAEVVRTRFPRDPRKSPPPKPESVSLTVTGPNPDYSPQAEIEMWKGLLDKAEAKMVAALIERNRDAAILDALPEILAFCRKSGNVVGLVNWLRRQSDV